MIDNSQVEKVMRVLEEMEDEQAATSLLREFNDKTKELGVLILNKDPSLDHKVWKEECDQAQKEVDHIVEKILIQGQ